MDECSTTSGAACTSAPCKSTGYSVAPDSDVDDCCRSHDICCAGTDRRGCNDALLSCWHSTPWTTPMCKTEDGIGFPAAALETGMYINGGLLGHDCCGGDCNAYELELTANETAARSMMGAGTEPVGNAMSASVQSVDAEADANVTSQSGACGGLAGTYSFTWQSSWAGSCGPTAHAAGTATIVGGAAFILTAHATSAATDHCPLDWQDTKIIGQCMDDGSVSATAVGLTGVFVGTELVLAGGGSSYDFVKVGNVIV